MGVSFEPPSFAEMIRLPALLEEEREPRTVGEVVSFYDKSTRSIREAWVGVIGKDVDFVQTPIAVRRGVGGKVVPRSLLFDDDGNYQPILDDEGAFTQSGLRLLLDDMEKYRTSWLVGGEGDGSNLALFIVNDAPLLEGAEERIQARMQELPFIDGIEVRWINSPGIVSEAPDIVRAAYDAVQGLLGERQLASLTMAFTEEQEARMDLSNPDNLPVSFLRTQEPDVESGMVISISALGLGLFLDLDLRELIPSVLSDYFQWGPDRILILRLVPIAIDEYLDQIRRARAAEIAA